MFSGLKKIACLGLFLPLAAVSAPLSGTFSYYANGHDIKTVLTSFARTQGMSPEFDPAVEGRISGQFKRVKAADFMNAMAEAYGVGYYTLGQNLCFYPLSGIKKEFITVPSGTTDDLIVSLLHSGYLSEELPIHVNPEGNMLTVTGPQGYIDQLKSAAQAYMAVQKEKIVMRVFPVKYAWADDIDLNNLDNRITVPGIATILRGIVMGQSVNGETVYQEKDRAGRAVSVGAAGLSAQKRDEAPMSEANATPVSKGAISIMADPRVNAVLVSDALYRMPYYEEVIAELDKPVQLVEIHAAIVDIDTNASRELGINFSGSGTDGHWQSGGSLGSANTDGFNNNGQPVINAASSTGGALLSTIYTHGSDVFMARISALESQKAAKMLGRPSVLTVDNVQAVLENTTTYYIPLQGKEAVDLFKVESGTVLRVTPHIINDTDKTSIKLAVSVQDDQNDSAGGYQSVGDDGAGLTVSPIKQTKITTQAMVDAGQSLLIGGYYYEQKTQGESGVPLLKDIPLLGALFRTDTKVGRRMERLILITPRIVSLGYDNVPERLGEQGFSRSVTDGTYELALPDEEDNRR